MKTIFSKNAQLNSAKSTTTKVGIYKAAFIYMLALLLLGLTFKAEKKKTAHAAKARALATAQK